MEIQLYKTYNYYGTGKNNGARLYIIPEIKALWVESFGYPSEEEYKTIILEGLNLIKEKSLEHWISDARNLDLILESVNQWTITEALPIAAQNGLRRLSFLMPQEFFAHFSMESLAQDIMEQLKALQIDTLQAKYFNSLEEAMQWRE